MARLILSLDGQILAEYNLNKERCSIGRYADNDIRIENPAVSGHHVLITNILNDSFLEDLNSTNGTYVNGTLVKRHSLQHGDVITAGRHQLRFIEDHDIADSEFQKTAVLDAAPISGAATPPAPAKVQVVFGALAGQEMPLTKTITTLGRPGTEVVAITRRAEGHYIVLVEDARGNTGPMVNGTRRGPQPQR
ncbi:MAG: hypothetical protein RLZZ393_782, partial [Pseudomonadota bacterium]